MKTVRNLLIVLLILAATTYAAIYRSNFHEVIEGEVYRSAQLSGATLKRKVRKHDIRTVINLREPAPDEAWYPEEIAAAEELGVEHRTIGMFQGSPRIDQILDLADLLGAAERPLLVHCRAGADRTGLAAVLTLLLEGEQDLDRVAEQVQWKYGAVRSDSMGKVFLAEYRQWLTDEGLQHTPDVLDRWLRTDYVDPTGNIHFLVHPIDGEPWLKPFGGHEDGVEFRVSRDGRATLDLDGWAFDTRQHSPLAGLRVFLGGMEFTEVEYGLPTPWLMDDFGREEWLHSGWAAKYPLAELRDGCYDLTFIFERLDGSTWASPPAGRICIG